MEICAFGLSPITNRRGAPHPLVILSEAKLRHLRIIFLGCGNNFGGDQFANLGDFPPHADLVLGFRR